MTKVQTLERPNPLTEQADQAVDTIFSKDIWKVMEDPDTGMVYLKNPPDYSAFEETFAWEKTFSKEKDRRRQDEPIRARVSDGLKFLRARFRRWETIEKETIKLLKQLRQQKERLAVVDIGCGIGTKLARVHDYMSNVQGLSFIPVGVELSKEQARIADEHFKQSGGYCIQDPALEATASMLDKSMDLIIMCSFLEHEINPLPLLRHSCDKLTDEGMILIKVPNFDCVNRKFRQQKWCGLRYPDHVNYFTPETLLKMTAKAGLEKVWLRAQPFNDNMWLVVRRAAQRN